MDFPGTPSDQCTIGLVLPVWSDTQVFLDGDGGFSVTSAEATRIFKPVSMQTMWSVLQALHGCCERAVSGAVIPGSGLDWGQHYQSHVESDQHCLNEWGAMTGLESLRKDSGGHSSSERESVERQIKGQLREIMRTEDLENITSKQCIRSEDRLAFFHLEVRSFGGKSSLLGGPHYSKVRATLEASLDMDMKNYKEYIDNEMMVTMAQMDKPSKILDYLYLGSEWNAANFEELQKNNVGYILNVTMEIDNFYPESFSYMNIRVYDVEATDLLSHWNNTYTFINRARQSGQAVLVHCKMGVSRSASTVTAFLMKKLGWSLDHALSHTRERRPIVQPNEGFLKQLHTYRGILNASKQRHSALWRRRSKEFRSNDEEEEEDGDDDEESGEEEESPEEERDSEEEKEVFEDPIPQAESPWTPKAPAVDLATPSPTIIIQESDKVCPSPNRSGRMNLFSLMQSICELDDEDRGSDKELGASHRRSPGQRRRSLGRRGLIHQRAHVDVSPEPSSLSERRRQEGAGPKPTASEGGEGKEEGMGGGDGEMEGGKSG